MRFQSWESCGLLLNKLVVVYDAVVVELMGDEEWEGKKLELMNCNILEASKVPSKASSQKSSTRYFSGKCR
jgi:hypothetical protein